VRAHVLDRVRVFGDLAEVVLDVDGLDLVGHGLSVLGEIIDGVLHVSVRDGAGGRLVGVGLCVSAWSSLPIREQSHAVTVESGSRRPIGSESIHFLTHQGAIK